jgi:hypothetical protein
MNVKRAVAALVASVVVAAAAGVVFVVTLPGCGGCDAEATCLEKEGTYLEYGSKVSTLCDAAPTNDMGTPAHYKWTTGSGTCSCTMEPCTNCAGYNWRSCTFNRGSGGSGGGGAGGAGGSGGGGSGGAGGSSGGSCAECTESTAASDCGAGKACVRRRCDGLLACVATGTENTCASIGGVTCPAISEFGLCASNVDGCWNATSISSARCDTVSQTLPARCGRDCNYDTDCVNSPAKAFDTRAQLCRYRYFPYMCSGACKTCVLTCSTTQMSCPTGMTCRIDSGMTDGYCW